MLGDTPVLNRLGFDDAPNKDDEAKAGFVFENKDGELLGGNTEPPVCPNSVVLVDDVNGFELAADGLLNVLNVLVEGRPVEVLANGLFIGADENWPGLAWPKGFGCGAGVWLKGFCCGAGV